MTNEERAAQIWPLLTFAASMRVTLTYGRLAQIIGGMPPALGRWMEPIQSYCLINKLPALSVIVVSEVTGMPGSGFVAAADVPEAQAAVFKYDWFAMKHVPSAAELADAVSKQPSNGVPPIGRERAG
jgi:putative restriction endonuclease